MIKLLPNNNGKIRIAKWLISFIIIGCSNIKKPIEHINPEFQPYYDEFQARYDIPNISIPIEFYTPSEPTNNIGLCYRSNIGNWIYINKKAWELMSEAGKIILIYHELGHCLFQRPHNEELMFDFCPKSLMYPRAFSDYCFYKYEGHYYEELWQQN